MNNEKLNLKRVNSCFCIVVFKDSTVVTAEANKKDESDFTLPEMEKWIHDTKPEVVVSASCYYNLPKINIR